MNNDLISRSALLENYGLKNAVKYGNETAEQQHNSYSTLMLYEIAEMINDAPAVDAEVARHGRWTEDGLCMGCGFDALYLENTSIQVRSHYCPNCGAKMDGDKDD